MPDVCSFIMENLLACVSAPGYPGARLLPVRDIMNRLFSILAFLVLSLPCTASADWALVRGSGPLASFESSARPAVAIKASPEFFTVAQGKMTVLLHEDRSLDGVANGTVWYCLSARPDDSQLAVALADAGELKWYPGIAGSNLEGITILYTSGSDRPGTVTQRVFVRPIQLDPWMDAFKADGVGWNASVLVSQYEWLDSTSGSKLLVEYREPLPVEKEPVIIPEKLEKFIHRADTSFSALFPEDSSIEASSITPYVWNSEGVSSRLLSDVLGTTTLPGGGS